jgi:hypothetical protein
VHESVHAAFDLAKESPADDLDEAAAYLAETVFIMAGGLKITYPGADAGAAILTAANEAVERLKLHQKRGQRLRREPVLQRIQLLEWHIGVQRPASSVPRR